jgi:hypothetical protein
MLDRCLIEDMYGFIGEIKNTIKKKEKRRRCTIEPAGWSLALSCL